MALKIFKADENKVMRVNSRVNKRGKNLYKSKRFKNEKLKNLTHIWAMKEPIFITCGAKKAFNHL